MNRDRARIANLLGQDKPWYRIENTASGTELWIYDEISFYGITADNFVTDLRGISSREITVHLNSPGGDVFDGIAIYNALRNHPARVTTKVDSLAASIASVIAQAGDHRVMVQHGQMMIHEAHGVMAGNAEEMAQFAILLDRQSDLIADIYANRAGDPKRAAEFRDLMRAETWLRDEEAVALGLADEVEQPPAKANDELVNEPNNHMVRDDWRALLDAAAARSLEDLLR